MTLYTVTIAGVSPSPEVYGGLVAATAYVGAMIGDGPTAWRALSTDDQGRTLRAATLYLDRLGWQGTANATGGTTLQWPRDNVIVTGAAVDATTVPAAIVSACFELAVLIGSDSDVIGAVDQSSNIAEVGAGSARVRFFNPTQLTDGTATKLPYVVQQLVGAYLGAAVGGDNGLSQGGACESAMAWWRNLDRRNPY